MTRPGPSDIIACPSCGARHQRISYASINFSGWEEWSDGRRGGHLFKPHDTVSRCRCGALFMPDQCEVVARADWQWEGRSNWRTEIFEGPKWKGYPAPPKRTPGMTTQVMVSVVASLKDDTPRDLEIAFRRQLWRALNDPFRAISWARDLGLPRPPADSRHTDNIRRLRSLIAQRLKREKRYLYVDEVESSWREIGEIGLEVGDVQGAQRALKRNSRDKARVPHWGPWKPPRSFCATDGSLELNARREAWLEYNERRRWASPPGPSRPVPQAGPAQAENLLRLRNLLIDQDTPDWCEIGEVNRELGLFAAALAAFDRATNPQSEELVGFLRQLAQTGHADVARFRESKDEPMERLWGEADRLIEEDPTDDPLEEGEDTRRGNVLARAGASLAKWLSGSRDS